MTRSVTVFDPPLCCPTGVCSPAPDPDLARFSGDLDLLRARGHVVRRFNLAQEPGAFAANEVVRSALATRGTACLPLILVDGAMVSEGRYPDRARLLELVSAAPTSTRSGGCCGGESDEGDEGDEGAEEGSTGCCDGEPEPDECEEGAEQGGCCG